MATSLIHFDTERSHGTVPAPLTWFPPGYPSAIAAVSLIGLSLEASALAISIASFVLIAAGLWHITRIFDPSFWTARVAVFCWVANSHALTGAVSALSESMFTAFGLASLICLLHTVGARSAARNTAWWIGSAVAAGLSYSVRYAGILWIATLFAALVMQVAAPGSNRRALLRPVMVLGVSLLLFVMPLMIRNMILVGDWRGGNNTPATKPVRVLITEAPRILHHLILGDGEVARLRVSMALMALGFLGLLALIVRATGRHPILSPQEGLSSPLSLRRGSILLAALLIYGAGITVIASQCVISYSPRMYLPALPHVIALVICGVGFLVRRAAVNAHWQRICAAAVLCSLVGYAAGNIISRVSLTPDIYQLTDAALAQQGKTGRPVRQFLDQQLKPGEVVVATNDQAAGYILKRPAVSLVGRPYTLRTWNESEVRTQLAHYGASRLLLFRNAEMDPVVGESPFLRALSMGQSPPWLEIADCNRQPGRIHIRC